MLEIVRVLPICTGALSCSTMKIMATTRPLIIAAIGLIAFGSAAPCFGVDADHDATPEGGASGSPTQITLPTVRTKPQELVSLRIKLPFPEGLRYEVYQGHGGSFSHGGLNSYAWDFGLPEGASVCAAAQGKVVRVKQDSSSGGTRREDFGLANTIVIDHGNGLFTQYLHLKRNSAKVVEGEIVQGGQVLAQSGNTGYSSIPHLHFQVQDATGQSLPAAFLDVPGNGIPQQGRSYTSGNDGMGVSHYAGESPMPLDAFTRNSVLLTATDLPGHLLFTNRTYHLEGMVVNRTRRVAIYLMNTSGGRAVTSVFAEVDENGRFTSKLNFAEMVRKARGWSGVKNQSNSFALAVCPVETDGSYWSNFSVPVSLR